MLCCDVLCCACLLLVAAALVVFDDGLGLVVPFSEAFAAEVECVVVAATHEDFLTAELFDPEVFAVHLNHIAFGRFGFGGGGSFGFGDELGFGGGGGGDASDNSDRCHFILAEFWGCGS